MTRLKGLRNAAVVLAATLVGAACGGSAGGGGGDNGNKGEIHIGVEMPLSGTESTQGQPILKGVQYAAQRAGKVKGYTIKVIAFDDAVNGVHDPQKGAQNVQSMVGDSKLLGFVGPLNSNVAKTELPIASDANLAMISPANTGVCLTKDGADPRFPYDAACGGLAKQLRKSNPNNYFRVVTTDDYQGPAMADYFLQVLKIQKVAVASDNQTYGKGISDAFTAEFKAKGGQVVGPRNDYDQNTTDFKPFLTAAKNAGAQGIYVGGTTGTKVCQVRGQMKGIFDVSAPFGGGDGIVQDGECVGQAGELAPNVYASIAAVDPVHVPSAKSVIDGYKKAFPGANDYTAYSIVATDAGGILLSAIGKAIDDNGGNMPKRDGVRKAVASTKNYQGALGSTSFDANGDTSVKIISIYKYNSPDPNKANDEPWVAQENFGDSKPTVKTS